MPDEPQAPNIDDLRQRLQALRGAMPSAGSALDPSELWKRLQSLKQQQEADQPSIWSSLWQGLKKGVTGAGQEAAQLASRMPTILPGAEAGRQRMQADITRRMGESETAYQADPAVKAHPLAAGAGRIAGEIVPSAALGVLVPGAGVPGIAARLGRGAVAGGLGAALTPTKDDDYWQAKTKQIAVGMLGGGALGGAIGAAAPRGAAATMAQAGVPLTSGMQLGMRPVETMLKGFPILRGMINRGEAKAIDGLNRAVGSQVLEPIGDSVPRNMKAGHGLVDFVRDRLSSAYDRVLPNVSFSETEWQNLVGSPQAQRIVKDLAPDDAQRLSHFLNSRVTDRFQNGILDGQAFKAAESELTNKASTFEKAPQTAELGDALDRVISMMRDSLVQQNPQYAKELRNVNYGWAMYVAMRKAASGATAEGKFSPTDLLRATKRLSGEASFARGTALMQAFGEAAERTFGKVTSPENTLPHYGLRNLATLLEVGGGAGFLRGGVGGAGTGAAATAALPYAARAGMGAAAALGRTPGMAQAPAAAAAGRASAGFESELSKNRKRIAAATRVGEIQKERFDANRRGDIARMQKLSGDLADAQAEYRRLGGGQ